MINPDAIYEIPLYVVFVLGVYTIYLLIRAKRHFGRSPLADSYKWIIIAAVFISLWAVFHTYDDLFVKDLDLKRFLHYGLSHVFLLISVICIAISARIIRKFTFSMGEKGKETSLYQAEE